MRGLQEAVGACRQNCLEVTRQEVKRLRKISSMSGCDSDVPGAWAVARPRLDGNSVIPRCAAVMIGTTLPKRVLR
jgi:hypothetical protein